MTTGIESESAVREVFRLREHGTTPRAELRGGVVTFLAMAYVIFVQPGVLSGAGMDFGAVMVATCVSAAAATMLMGLLVYVGHDEAGLVQYLAIVDGDGGKTLIYLEELPQIPAELSDGPALA